MGQPCILAGIRSVAYHGRHRLMVACVGLNVKGSRMLNTESGHPRGAQKYSANTFVPSSRMRIAGAGKWM